MTNTKLNIVSLCVALAGCSGGAFGGTAATDGGPGAGGESGTGDAGDASGGTPASGGSPATGGKAGAAATGGTGGASPSTGGVTGAGGSPATGGATATGGASPDGGAGTTGAGGVPAAEAGRTCKPPVVDATNLPTNMVWQSYLSKYGTTCLTCTHSPCTTCPLTWWPVTQSADGLTVTATINQGACAPMPLNMGPCTSDLTAGSCTTLNPSVEATFVLRLEPKSDGTGYRVADASGEQAHLARLYGTCGGGGIQGYAAFDNAWAASPAEQGLLSAAHATMLAAQWPCGQ